MLTKVCSTCKEIKLKELFAKDNSKKDKLRYQCRACHTESKKDHYKDNKDKILEANRQYRVVNSDLIRVSKQRYRKENPQKIRELSRQYSRRDRKRNPAKYAAKASYRRVKVRQATPVWVDRAAINGMYQLAALFNNVGITMHVDHVVPLRSDLVCGLHCEANLQLLPASDNTSKGNRWWPDMW